MKKILSSILGLCLTLSLAAVFAGEVPVNSMQFTLDNQDVLLLDDVKAFLSQKDDGQYCLQIGYASKVNKSMVLMKFNLTQKLNQTLVLSTDYNQIALTGHLGGKTHFTVIPAVVVHQTPKVKAQKNNDPRMARMAANAQWRGMQRSEQLATGQGVTKEHYFKGTALYVTIRPIMNGDQVVRVELSFSGRVNGDKGKILILKNGLANVEVCHE